MLRRCHFWRCTDHATKLRKDIEARVVQLTEEKLRPVDTLKAFVSKSPQSQPTVLFIGNHSSGKSSFINSLLCRKEQETGNAPTDDGFTVIERAEYDADEDGPTAVSSPTLGFSGLNKFGNKFINRFCVKHRKLPLESPLPKNMILIDSPGMINTHTDETTHNLPLDDIKRQKRGYDFLGVTKWFAQRADVIMLMFDPHNPGTTGETLDVLTESLSGMEHKFYILVNKSDTFTNAVDFARSYAALTWNLSKVIPQKDLPIIFTTYTAVAEASSSREHSTLSLDELDRQRAKVVNLILNAPMRRLDHMVTELLNSALRLEMYTTVSNHVRAKYGNLRNMHLASFAVSTVLVPAALASMFAPIDAAVAVFMTFGLLTVLGTQYFVMQRTLANFRNAVVEELDAGFVATYPRHERTRDVEQRWEMVKKVIMDELREHRPLEVCLPKTPKYQLKQLSHIITREVPDLRSQVDQYKRKAEHTQPFHKS